MSADTNSFFRQIRKKKPGLPQSPLHAARQYNSHNSPENGTKRTPGNAAKGNLKTTIWKYGPKPNFEGLPPCIFPGVNLAFTRAYWWGLLVSSSASGQSPVDVATSKSRTRERVTTSHTHYPPKSPRAAPSTFPFPSLPLIHLRPPPSA